MSHQQDRPSYGTSWSLPPQISTAWSPYHQAMVPQDASSYTQQYADTVDQVRNSQAQAGPAPRVASQEYDNFNGAEAGSWGQLYDDNTGTSPRATVSDPRLISNFVKQNQQQLGGLKHKLSTKSHRTKELRRSQARNTLASFDRLYNPDKIKDNKSHTTR